MPDKKPFLKLPEYPGGKDQFRKFIKANLKYPAEALKNKVEGTVLLSADITDSGFVRNIKVENGIGYGCDEEAIRILGLAHFGEVKNRGVRVTTRKKFKINFKIPRQQAKRTFLFSYNETKTTQKKTEEKPPVKYSYTITINKNQ